MTWPGLAIAMHLLAVVWWIGGLAFVTLVFLPALRAGELTADPHVLLDVVERRFALQARLAVGLAGLSGAYLLWVSGLWHVLNRGSFWWLDAMIGYWLVFALILFILEPLGVLQRVIFNDRDPASAWRRFHAVHVVLLGIGVVIVAAAAASSHGF